MIPQQEPRQETGLRLWTDPELRGELERLADEAPAYEPPAQGAGGDDDRPAITVSTEERQVNDAAVEALAREGNLYQRGGLLVRVLRDRSPATKGSRRRLGPRIDPLPAPVLREYLAANARWVAPKAKDLVPAHPPGWCVSAVHARGQWPAIRHLEGVVDHPVLRPDGAVLTEPGYDAATGLLLVPRGKLPAVPDEPTRDDAVAARDVLLRVVEDFPFAAAMDRAAWVAALLTPLARFAFPGPAPLFLVDANCPAAGKGLLLHALSTIIRGHDFSVTTYPKEEDELRKRITAIAVSGERMVLFDNLVGNFGGGTLDAALTGTEWEDRVLGVNRMYKGPLSVTWYATGNNVSVVGDTARRVCHVRLEVPEERPELRRGFRHPQLLRWVRANRRRLLAARGLPPRRALRAGDRAVRVPLPARAGTLSPREHASGRVGTRRRRRHRLQVRGA